mmetsp:Transcript_27742/g.65191  ORF Transcript_27742/g.65191 Transcript_27742/m.65191 type:complete len:250 (+) Transcript_27742:1590-2339(+)
MLEEAGIHLDETKLESTILVRDVLPLRHGWVHLRQLRRTGDPSHRLLLLERDVAELVPAHVELSLVLVGPLLVHMVGPMGAPRGEVDEKRPVRGQRPIVADELDGLVSEILGEMIALLCCVGRLDRVGVLEQPRLVLRRLTGDEAVEVAETKPCRILVERAGLKQIVDWGVVPLSECCRIIAVSRQHLCHRRRGLWDCSGVARKACCSLCDLPSADVVRIPAGQNGSPRGRADCGGVEAIVGHTPRRDL